MQNLAKISVLLVLFALFTAMTTVSLTGCGYFNSETTRIVALEDKIAKLEAANDKLQAAWNEHAKSFAGEIEKLTAENEALKKENAELQGHVTSLNHVLAKIDDARIDKDISKFIIGFGHNKLYNKKDTRAVTAKVMALAKKHDFKVKITIEGYSSKAGPAKLNKWFSKERAEGVMHKLYGAHNNGELDLKVIAHGETDDNERKVVVTVEVLE